MVNLLGCNADSGWWIQPPSATRQEELMVRWRILFLPSSKVISCPFSRGFRLVASPASFFSFVPLSFASVSDSLPYLSCLCLPLRTSFFVVPNHLAARTPLWREFCLRVLSRFQLPSTTLSNPFDSLFTNIYMKRLECKRF